MFVFDRVIVLLLGVWAFLFGVLQVSNLKVEAMSTIMGYAALILGVVCIVRALMGFMAAKPIA